MRRGRFMRLGLSFAALLAGQLREAWVRTQRLVDAPRASSIDAHLARRFETAINIPPDNAISNHVLGSGILATRNPLSPLSCVGIVPSQNADIKASPSSPHQPPRSMRRSSPMLRKYNVSVHSSTFPP